MSLVEKISLMFYKLVINDICLWKILLILILLLNFIELIFLITVFRMLLKIFMPFSLKKNDFFCSDARLFKV